ncbi:MAG: hypothetical protein ORN56_07350 [Chitinophagales bacterium]|nr:hypothetical protein [Chitinophagales bacterium]
MTRIPSISACMFQPELFFSLQTDELERLQLRYPYFADIPALLAKKYQQSGDMRANSQLVRAALYSSDRALLMKWMTIHLMMADASGINVAAPAEEAPIAKPIVEEKPSAPLVAETSSICLEVTPVVNTPVVEAAPLAEVSVTSSAPIEAEAREEIKSVAEAPVETPRLEMTEKPKKKRGPKKPGHDIDWEALYEDAKKPHSQDARLKALDDELDSLIRSAAALAASDREAYFSDEYVEMDMEIDENEMIDLSFFKKDKDVVKDKEKVEQTAKVPLPATEAVKVEEIEKKSTEAMANEVKTEQNPENQENKSAFLSFLKQHSKGSAIGQNRARTHASQLRKVMDEFVQSFEDAASGVENPQVDVLEMSVYGLQEHDDFITETMAEMLVKQEKYEKAIAAFEKLRLLKPEKSVFFATRISEIKNKLNQL